jgi:hypothetical protein
MPHLLACAVSDGSARPACETQYQNVIPVSIIVLELDSNFRYHQGQRKAQGSPAFEGEASRLESNHALQARLLGIVQAEPEPEPVL